MHGINCNTWKKEILQNEQHFRYFLHMLWNAESPFSLSLYFFAPLPPVHSALPSPPSRLFALLCAPCALKWSPCTGVASWGELVKHLLWALQFCIILASTQSHSCLAFNFPSEVQPYMKRGSGGVALAHLYIPGLILYQENKKVSDGRKIE